MSKKIAFFPLKHMMKKQRKTAFFSKKSKRKTSDFLVSIAQKRKEFYAEISFK